MKAFIDRYSEIRLKKIFVIALAFVFVSACSKNNASMTKVSDCNGSPKSFGADVNTIIQTSCAFDSDCHGSESSSGPGPLLTYSQIFNARATIASAVSSGLMPLNATLSSGEKNAIICWIDNGAQNN
jgi:hypothetical protein